MNDIIIAVASFAATGLLGAFVTVAAKTYKAVGALDHKVEAILDAGAVQAKNTVKLLEIDRYVVKALRSHSYAFREV